MPLPSVTSGLQWWFDARDISGVLDGAAVSSWADSTVNAHTATVSTGSAIYHTSQFLGGAALTLSSCRFGISGSLTETGVHTVFAVFRSSGLGGNQTICGQNGTHGLNHRLGQTNAGSVRLQFAWADGGTGMEGTGTALLDTGWHQAFLQQNSSIGLAFLLDVATDTFIAGSALSAGLHSPITLGGTGAGEFLGGQLQIVGYWNRILSSLELAAVWLTATPPTPPSSHVRGNIDEDQIGLDARHGPSYGILVQYSDATHTTGNVPKFLSDGTLTDSGTSSVSIGATPLLDAAGNPLFDVNGVWIYP